jgi:hypothetical protein
MSILRLDKELMLMLTLVLLGTVALTGVINSVTAQKQPVTLTAIVAEPKERWDILFDNASKKLNENHPDMDIKIDYRVLPYDATRTQISPRMPVLGEDRVIGIQLTGKEASTRIKYTEYGHGQMCEHHGIGKIY